MISILFLGGKPLQVFFEGEGVRSDLVFLKLPEKKSSPLPPPPPPCLCTMTDAQHICISCSIKKNESGVHSLSAKCILTGRER